jgi:phytoene dehydrogenase-like protein
MGIAFPDIRDGLCIPLAQAVEQRGGEVWRGQRVQQILVEDDQVGGIVLADGREVRSSMVAVATGNSRIPNLFESLPAELEAPLAYSARHATEDFCTFAVLDRPVVPSQQDRSFLFVTGGNGSAIQVSWPLHAAAPWTTEPGTQFVLAQSFFRDRAAVEAAGGEAAIYASMHTINEELYPGYQAAMIDSATQRHQHHWVTPCTVGPKLPRTIPSVRGLWFVGDGSVPTNGVYTEGAASGGILGARAMLGRDGTPCP